MKTIKKIHFVGIKGVGIAPLAIIAKQAGFEVTGSDIPDTFITSQPLEKVGITPYKSFSSRHIDGVDLVITTGAHGGYSNPEVKAARIKHIPILTQGEAVGEFMRGDLFEKSLTGISVAGTHGKTTTTAMIATIFSVAKKDPSFVIGTGAIPSLQNMPGHFGSGEYFIAEADEYATEPTENKLPKMIWQHPKFAVFTNIEFDHPDLYPTLDDVREAFLLFAKNVQKDNGTLIVCGDDPQIQKLLREYTGNNITYGLRRENDCVITKVKISNKATTFWVKDLQRDLGEFSLGVVGEHNCLNALAATIVALQCDIPLEIIKKGLQHFSGTKRRLEYIGQVTSGAFLFDDYAHHPTEIQKTLSAVKSKYKNKKIVCIFQPHTYSRTKLLFDEFISSFKDCNTLLLTNIYASAREPYDASITSEMLAQSIKKPTEVIFLPELIDVVQYIENKHFGDDTILLTMGAGDIYKIQESLL